jgi:hypothetical protein
MTRFQQDTCWAKAVTRIMAVVILAIPLISSNVFAIDIVERHRWDNSVQVQTGYFVAKRGAFRDIYGEGIAFAVGYERAINAKIGLGGRVSRTQFGNDHGEVYVSATETISYKMKYREFAVAPLITYNLKQSGSLRVFAGGGVGISFRKITLEDPLSMILSDAAAIVKFSDSETSPYGLLVVGTDLAISPKAFFGLRVSLDHHFFGNPESGDLGDSGGFGFAGSFGFGF